MIYALALVVFLTSWILPWWGFCAVCFLFGHKMKSAFSAFNTAFVSVSVVWLMQCYLQNIRSHGLMATKMAELLSISQPMLMILIVPVIGGFVGGLWCASGFYLDQLRVSAGGPKAKSN